MRSIYITLSLFFLAISCNEYASNKKEIKVSGCVTDSITKAPVRGAKVTLLCWYNVGWDKTDYKSIDTIADNHGCFSATFNNGYKVVVASVASRYYPNLKATEEINNINVRLDLNLVRKTDITDTALPKVVLRYYIVQNSSE
jgi:hypothetical protein